MLNPTVVKGKHGCPGSIFPPCGQAASPFLVTAFRPGTQQGQSALTLSGITARNSQPSGLHQPLSPVREETQMLGWAPGAPTQGMWRDGQLPLGRRNWGLLVVALSQDIPGEEADNERTCIGREHRASHTQSCDLLEVLIVFSENHRPSS